LLFSARLRAFCSSGPVQNTKSSSIQTPTNGVTCGRPSARTVVSKYSSAAAQTAALGARDVAFPTGYQIPPHYRVRHDRIDAAGVITIRYNSRLHHIGLSKHLRGTNVTVLIDDLDIRVLDHNTGTLIRKLVLDYQPRGVKCGNSPENRP
jgi:hypothetical protein